MSGTLSYVGLPGLLNQYFRLKRMRDGYWWNASTQTWVATAVAGCNITIAAETTSGQGDYAATDSNLAPQEGGEYEAYVYTSAGVQIQSNRFVYRPAQSTLIQIIAQVQRSQGMIESSTLDADGLRLQKIINDIMTDDMMEDVEWDELKLRGSFQTVANVSNYYISPINAPNIDVIKYLRISDSVPFIHYTEDEFRDYKRRNLTATGQPIIYRRIMRAGNIIGIELCPIPDAIYTVDYEGAFRPTPLAATSDIPVLDVSTIIKGATWKYRASLFLDPSVELSDFRHKMAMQNNNQGSTNNGGDFIAI